MTPDMNWKKNDIHHVKSICMFDTSKDDETKDAFKWKNTQPMLQEVHQKKGIKYYVKDYHLQVIKADQFSKLNEERLN